jgi:hypothetical protein
MGLINSKNRVKGNKRNSYTILTTMVFVTFIPLDKLYERYLLYQKEF